MKLIFTRSFTIQDTYIPKIKFKKSIAQQYAVRSLLLITSRLFWSLVVVIKVNYEEAMIPNCKKIGPVILVAYARGRFFKFRKFSVSRYPKTPTTGHLKIILKLIISILGFPLRDSRKIDILIECTA